MRTLVSIIFVVIGLGVIALAQTPPTAGSVAGAALQAAATAAMNSVAQQAPTVTTTLGNGVFWGAIVTAYGAIGMIVSGLTQLLGIGARSSNKKVAQASSVGIAALQHYAGAPNVSTTPTTITPAS